MSIKDYQIGGDHYKKCKIQPIEYIYANELDFFEGNIVKYVTRHRTKGEGEKDGMGFLNFLYRYNPYLAEKYKFEKLHT